MKRVITASENNIDDLEQFVLETYDPKSVLMEALKQMSDDDREEFLKYYVENF